MAADMLIWGRGGGSKNFGKSSFVILEHSLMVIRIRNMFSSSTKTILLPAIGGNFTTECLAFGKTEKLNKPLEKIMPTLVSNIS